MKKIFSLKAIIVLLILMSVYSNSTAQLIITPGVHVVSNGTTTQIVLANTSLINNGTINHSSGTIKFAGGSTNSISGHGSLVFYNFELAKSTGVTLALSKNIGIKNRLTFTSGLLNLNDNDIDLFATGLLINEREASRIVGNNGGKVKITKTLNAPNAANPGNLGVILTSVENMGSVLIQRGHQSQINDQGTGNSILRYYDIDPANNFNLKATLRFQYFNAELNGINEADLVLFKGSAAGSWVEKGYTTRDGALNYVEKINNPDFSRWTLSNIGNPLASGCPGGLPSQTYYADIDGDGFGDATSIIEACAQPAGYVANKNDCNDKNASVHPGATEICNGIDDDCDGSVDENVKNTYYQDADGDGYGSNEEPVQSCSQPEGYVTSGGDCNDNDPTIQPGTREVCGNFTDDNCNGQVDEGCASTTPSINISDITVNESQGTAQLTVSLSGPSANSIRVNYRTLNGTASHPKDFTRKTGELVFNPGSTLQQVTISIIADDKSEPDEYFDVQLHDAFGATINDNSGRVTITESLITRSNSSDNPVSTDNISANERFDVVVSNNPARTQFRLDIYSGNETPVLVIVSDALGKIFERLQASHPFQPVYLGTTYRPGIYFVQVIQGTNRKTVKLIKL